MLNFIKKTKYCLKYVYLKMASVGIHEFILNFSKVLLTFKKICK